MPALRFHYFMRGGPVRRLECPGQVLVISNRDTNQDIGAPDRVVVWDSRPGAPGNSGEFRGRLRNCLIDADADLLRCFRFVRCAGFVICIDDIPSATTRVRGGCISRDGNDLVSVGERSRICHSYLA
jgi:hypothetical protein